MIYFYILIDKHGSVKYVGRTTDPVWRLKVHKQSKFKDWLCSLQIVELMENTIPLEN